VFFVLQKAHPKFIYFDAFLNPPSQREGAKSFDFGKSNEFSAYEKFLAD
jgi:hypothetical protein